MELNIGILVDYMIIPVILICICVGFLIKKSVPVIPNSLIPLILAVIGVIYNLWVNAWTLVPEVVLGGLLSGIASVGLYESFVTFMESQIGQIFKNLVGNEKKEE